MKHESKTCGGALPARLWAIVLAGAFGVLAANCGASTLTINFETLPALPTQPNNFAAAGAMQTYTDAGVFTISGGVALGNPTFLAAFAAHGSAPNLYGTADFADPSLLDTISLSMPSSALVTAISGVLFNGQPIAEDYLVSYFSGGVTPIFTQTFLGVQPDSSTSDFRNFSFVSSLLSPITLVTFTTPNAGLNGWDFFVDSIVLTQQQGTAPEPGALLLLSIGLVGLGASRSMHRRRASATPLTI